MITHHGRESSERGGCRAGGGAKSLGDVAAVSRRRLRDNQGDGNRRD